MLTTPKPKYTFAEFDHHVLPANIRELIKDIVYPPRRYLGYRNSAIVVLLDDTRIPLLLLMAKLKKPDWDPNLEEPIWEDTNWYNAKPGNVKFIPRHARSGRVGRTPKHDLGVPYGHPDYHKLYYERNKDKIRDYNRTRYARRRAVEEMVKDQLNEVKPEGMPKAPSDAFEGAMNERLADILTTQKAVAAPVVDSHKAFTWGSVRSQRLYPFGDDDPQYDLDDLGLDVVPQINRDDFKE